MPQPRVVLVTFAVVDPHSFRRRRATSCRQKLAHPRQEACILRRFVVDRADGCGDQVELLVGRKVFGQRWLRPHATEACSHKAMHLGRRLKLRAGGVLAGSNSDLAFFGEDSSNRGSNVPGEAGLRLDTLDGFKEWWDMLEPLSPITVAVHGQKALL